MNSTVIYSAIALVILVVVVVWLLTSKSPKKSKMPAYSRPIPSTVSMSNGTTPVAVSQKDMTTGITPISMEAVGLDNFNAANTDNIDFLPMELNSPGQIEMRDFETINGDDFDRWQDARVKMERD